MTFGASPFGAAPFGDSGGAEPTTAIILAPSPLGAPAVRVRYGSPVSAHVLAPSPLGGAAHVLAINDFTSLLDAQQPDRYVMDLIVSGAPVRVPISSWQATIQTGRANFLQTVVPAASGWMDAILAADEFVISRRSPTRAGEWVEHEMARVPLEQWSYDQGPQRATATISGYTAAAIDTGDTTAATYNRPLPGLRSISVSPSGVRARCAIDWLLRPGHTASADGETFVVAYINYYVNANDSYCDVGERV